MISISDKTEVLIEALPYIRRYEGKIFVVKYGGAAMVDEELEETFAQDVTLLKKVGVKVVIVHGGGKDVTEIATKFGIQSRFIDGQRYTDEPMMGVVQMVLAGKTNKDIVARINKHDGEAVGVCGIDADLIRVKKFTERDLGLVGEITSVNTLYLNLLLDHGIMPVIAPIGVNEDGQAHNINADVAAARIAAALKSEKLVYLSDVEGVIADSELIHSMDEAEAHQLIESGVISNGMIPKIRSAFKALEADVNKVHLIDGRVKHSLLLEIFTDAGVGTELIKAMSPELG
ncbi:MAG: acetylglutamate kinase [Ignavibacteria bacterium]|nr:acetylglutamate kinase [Ignavibacteria bacterium]MBI3765288.1 acetylglutamate kinase [Ignavibacteriales bacterium]